LSADLIFINDDELLDKTALNENESNLYRISVPQFGMAKEKINFYL